jgi:hypothetical protein
MSPFGADWFSSPQTQHTSSDPAGAVNEAEVIATELAGVPVQRATVAASTVMLT